MLTEVDIEEEPIVLIAAVLMRPICSSKLSLLPKMILMEITSKDNNALKQVKKNIFNFQFSCINYYYY